jgi:hypothetical protein
LLKKNSVLKDERSCTGNEFFFCNDVLWIRPRAANSVIFEANYENKLLVIASGRREIKRIFYNFKNVLFGYCF